MKTMFGGRGPGELGAFARTGWGTLIPINGEVEEVQGFAEGGWGMLVPVGTGEPAPSQYTNVLFGAADIQQARIQAPKIGQFDFDFPSPEIPSFDDLALPPAAPEPPAPAPAPEPAEPPTVEVTPEEFLFPVGIPSLACQTADGSFTLLDPATLAVIATGLAALPAGASLLPPTDPRCAAFLRAPAQAVSPAIAPAEGISTTTLAVGALAVVAAIALLS